MKKLESKLRSMDGRGYPTYKSIKGTYEFEDYRLEIVHVQGDPFAAPSRMQIFIPLKTLGLEQTPEPQRVGVCDAVLRDFEQALRGSPKGQGSGKSGQWAVCSIGQEMLRRSACEFAGEDLVLRFTLGLPAQGRRILGREAVALLCEDLPDTVDELLGAQRSRWEDHGKAYEDQEFLRGRLQEMGAMAWIGEGSVLARRTGVDDRPLQEAIAWKGPSEWEQEVEFPNAGTRRGTAIPMGVTLICGGGFHGKSTLLNAIARGVFAHIPGDGREWVVTRRDAVGVRAEDGRSVTGVDISSFINNLPGGKTTEKFSTPNASGSTSQAANIAEALEVGATTLLIDEDTSATNFMVRDRRMQELITKDKEPITPFVDRVRQLYEEHQVSTLLVVGGAGDYFEVTDWVLVMRDYLPSLETDSAKSIASQHPSHRVREQLPPLNKPSQRRVEVQSLNPNRGHKERVRSRSTRSIEFGREEIDVSQVPQVVDPGQLRWVGDWLREFSRRGEDTSLSQWATEFEAFDQPLSKICGPIGDRVECRRFELVAAISRLRALRVN